jgi:acyl-CoA dehydrogenase
MTATIESPRTLARGSAREIPAVAAEIGADVAAPFADAVDREARFPHETLAGLRDKRLLSATVPPGLGGGGATLSDACAAVEALGRHCASSAMVLAMHYLQVACLVRHGHNDLLRGYLRTLSSDQLLLASATTEIGTGGELRRSVCAVEVDEGRFRLEKQAPVVSYGAHADAVLATARRSPNSPPNDQVLVLCVAPGLQLEQTSVWDTLGMRGTVSPGFVLRAIGDADQIVADPFGDIAARTMVPVSHALWTHVWLGIAAAALDKAGKFVRSEAHKTPGTTPASATRLAEAMAQYLELRSAVHEGARLVEQAASDERDEPGMGLALSLNALKVSASTAVVEIVTKALRICGMAGYSQRSPYSLGRQLRDAHSAALMVSNDRLLGDNAQMLLLYKEL